LVEGSDGRGGPRSPAVAAAPKKGRPKAKPAHPSKQPEPVAAGAPTNQKDKGKTQAESNDDFLSLDDSEMKDF